MTSKMGGWIAAIILCLGIGGSLLWVGQVKRVVAKGLVQPALTVRFYGDVALNESSAPSGALLSAAIGQQVYATTEITLLQGISSYVIDIPGDDPGTAQVDGGREGDEVIFSLFGYRAPQHGIWHEGQVIALNLAFAPALTPSSTLTPPPTLTSLPTPPLRHLVTIPEPTTILLVSAGLAALAAIGTQRRRQ